MLYGTNPTITRDTLIIYLIIRLQEKKYHS
jgi:hypothetical protein